MKKLIFILLTSFSFLAFSQDVNFPKDESGKIAYSEVVTMNDSIKKDELFSRAKSCFAHLFKNSNRVIQNEDKEAGNIIGKGILKVYMKALGSLHEAGYVNYTLTIAVKDGKYKYTISDFIHDGAYPSAGNLDNGKPKQWPAKSWNSITEQVNEEVNSLVASIKQEMIKSTPKSDNW